MSSAFVAAMSIRLHTYSRLVASKTYPHRLSYLHESTVLVWHIYTYCNTITIIMFMTIEVRRTEQKCSRVPTDRRKPNVLYQIT